MTSSDTAPSCQTWLQGVRTSPEDTFHGGTFSNHILLRNQVTSPLTEVCSGFPVTLDTCISWRNWKLLFLKYASWKHRLWSSQWFRFTLTPPWVPQAITASRVYPTEEQLLQQQHHLTRDVLPSDVHNGNNHSEEPYAFQEANPTVKFCTALAWIWFCAALSLLQT